MTLRDQYKPEIQLRISERECLELLAEEASELAQAALKLIRAKLSTTPVSERTACKNLFEEIRDVLCVLDAMNYDLPFLVKNLKDYDKWQRWAERLKEGGDDD